MGIIELPWGSGGGSSHLEIQSVAPSYRSLRLIAACGHPDEEQDKETLQGGAYEVMGSCVSVQ